MMPKFIHQKMIVDHSKRSWFHYPLCLPLKASFDKHNDALHKCFTILLVRRAPDPTKKYFFFDITASVFCNEKKRVHFSHPDQSHARWTKKCKYDRGDAKNASDWKMRKQGVNTTWTFKSWVMMVWHIIFYSSLLLDVLQVTVSVALSDAPKLLSSPTVIKEP